MASTRCHLFFCISFPWATIFRVYIGYIPTSIVTRITDLIIGIFAAVGSLFTLGKIKKLNTIAYESLGALLILNDLYFGLGRTINPWATVK